MTHHQDTAARWMLHALPHVDEHIETVSGWTQPGADGVARHVEVHSCPESDRAKSVDFGCVLENHGRQLFHDGFEVAIQTVALLGVARGGRRQPAGEDQHALAQLLTDGHPHVYV